MKKKFNLNLNNEERKVIETFINDYKAYNWLTLAWRYFDGQCHYNNANKIVERLFLPSIKTVETEYGILKENFLDFWILQDEEKSELERIANLDETEYWVKYFSHEFDGYEEEAMNEFFKSWENEINTFFNIK